MGGAAVGNKRKLKSQSVSNMKLKQTLVVAGLAAVMGLGTSQVLAQNNGGQGNGGQGNGGRGGRNFDPAQMQQRIVDNLKDVLEVKDDAEWNALQPLVSKVIESRMASFGGMGRGLMGGRRNRGGNNGDTAAPADQQAPQRRGFGPPNPDADALQKAIDAKASKAEIKAALDKYVASRKAKQADLEKAQGDLRKVLTSRQEAIATLNGLL
jgi:hypothetical protein